MRSFCRSGLLALALVGGGTVGFGPASAVAEVKRIEHQNWVSHVSRERLADQSMLTEYFGESLATGGKEAALRVGFIPRFGCSPLITFTMALPPVASQESNSNTDPVEPFRQSSLVIDGAVVSFPSLVDNNGDSASVYMNASLQRRLNVKLRIEVGSRLALLLRNGERYTFSLVGSRDAISIASQNCRRHDPTVQG